MALSGLDQKGSLVPEGRRIGLLSVTRPFHYDVSNMIMKKMSRRGSLGEGKISFVWKKHVPK